MKLGRELDALIAEKVFGYKTFKTSNPFDYSGRDKNIYIMSQLDDIGHVEETKKYSTDIAAAWEVVEKLTKDSDRGFELHRLMEYPKLPEHPEGQKQHYLAYFSRGTSESADTAPHAICLAALKAVKE